MPFPFVPLVLGALGAIGANKLFNGGEKRRKLERAPKSPDLIRMDTAELPEAPEITSLSDAGNPNFTKLNRIANILAGREVIKKSDGSYEYRPIDETPEHKKFREGLARDYETTLNQLVVTAQNYKNLRTKLTPQFKQLMSTIGGLANHFDMPHLEKVGLGGLGGVLQRIKDYTTGQIEDLYAQGKEDLEGSLGKEGLNSSQGRWEMAMLRREKRQRLLDNDFWVVTEGTRKLLENQNLLLANQGSAIANQGGILANQGQYISNQGAELANQSTAIDNAYKPLFNETNLEVANQNILENAVQNYQSHTGQEQNIMSSMMDTGVQGVNTENNLKQQNYTNKFTEIQTDNTNKMDKWKTNTNFVLQKLQEENNNRLAKAGIGINRAATNANIAQQEQTINKNPLLPAVANAVGTVAGQITQHWLNNKFPIKSNKKETK